MDGRSFGVIYRWSNSVRTGSTSINAYLHIVVPFSTSFRFVPHLAGGLLSSKLSKNDIRSLLRDHVGRNGGKCTRNPRENGRINDTEASSSPDPEAGVKDSHWVVVRTDGAGGRRVVTPGGVLDVIINIRVLSWKHLIDLNELALEGAASKFDGF